MIIYPAIDLKDGQCVRLTRGEMDSAQVYNPDPAAQARAWQDAGFAWIHVVDLDGAVAGATRNLEAIRAILGAATVPVQLGGGIRTPAAAAKWLELGVARVILGTLAARDPGAARAICAAHPGRVAVGIDARGGMVALQGWTEQSGMRADDLARRAADWGAAAIIHTDIDRDGTHAGLNVAATGALARAVGIPVIASGGVGGAGDLRAAAADGAIAGAIVGKALYTGALTPREALEASES
jgi:phosphoribosylformimino-5-aminoimidazole carboxamide ribotide isomerase